MLTDKERLKDTIQQAIYEKKRDIHQILMELLWDYNMKKTDLDQIITEITKENPHISINSRCIINYDEETP